MALLQRLPQSGPSVSFYTIGQHRSVLIAGLGNIGREFDGTRHNTGFLCIDAFVQSNDAMGKWNENKSLKCLIAKGVIGDAQVVAIKPTTLMNLSGDAVQAVGHYYKITPENTAVIHDELDIAFGQIRMRFGGGSAGHNGIKSVSSRIGEDYYHVRVGIGPKHPPEIDSADFVLQRFNDQEKQQLVQLSREVTSVLTEFIATGKLSNETRSFIV